MEDLRLVPKGYTDSPKIPSIINDVNRLNVNPVEPLSFDGTQTYWPIEVVEEDGGIQARFGSFVGYGRTVAQAKAHLRQQINHLVGIANQQLARRES